MTRIANRQHALVQGSEKQAVMVEVEDSRGDLVDIEFYCDFDGCYEAEVKERGEDYGAVSRWPCYPFSPDYDSCCNRCGATINHV